MQRSPALVFATRSGGTTIDRDAFGGNPFATALIQLTGEASIPLQTFPKRLRALTVRASQRHQVPQWTRWPERRRWSFRLEPGSRERRCVLVLIVSDYAQAGLAPLGGAAHDERRVSAMFAANGFSVVQGVAPDRAALLDALAQFRRVSHEHEAAANLFDRPRSGIERQRLPVAGRLPGERWLLVDPLARSGSFGRTHCGRVSRDDTEPGVLRGLPHARIRNEPESDVTTGERCHSTFGTRQKPMCRPLRRCTCRRSTRRIEADAPAVLSYELRERQWREKHERH